MDDGTSGGSTSASRPENANWPGGAGPEPCWWEEPLPSGPMTTDWKQMTRGAEMLIVCRAECVCGGFFFMDRCQLPVSGRGFWAFWVILGVAHLKTPNSGFVISVRAVLLLRGVSGDLLRQKLTWWPHLDTAGGDHLTDPDLLLLLLLYSGSSLPQSTAASCPPVTSHPVLHAVGASPDPAPCCPPPC